MESFELKLSIDGFNGKVSLTKYHFKWLPFLVIICTALLALEHLSVACDISLKIN